MSFPSFSAFYRLLGEPSSNMPLSNANRIKRKILMLASILAHPFLLLSPCPTEHIHQYSTNTLCLVPFPRLCLNCSHCQEHLSSVLPARCSSFYLPPNTHGWEVHIHNKEMVQDSEWTRASNGQLGHPTTISTEGTGLKDISPCP